MHKEYLGNMKKFQIPIHEISFKANLLGLRKNDLWDYVSTVLKQAVENNDYPVFQTAIDQAIKLLLETYRFSTQEKDNYYELSGLQSVSRHRFRGLFYWVIEKDAEGILYRVMGK